MRWWALSGYGVSLLVHFGVAAGLSSIPKETRRRPTAVTVFEAKPKKEKPKEPDKQEKPPEPPKPIAVPKQVLMKAAEPLPPAEAPPPTSPTPAGHAAMAALPDFGISLGGGVGVGIGIPTGGGARAEGRGSGTGTGAEKRPKAVAPQPASSAEAPCTEPPTKAEFQNRVMPQFPTEAQSANIEGKIRVEFTINGEGAVIAARVVEGVGHGLDEAALVAAKRSTFIPIKKCGKPVAAPPPFIKAYRFGFSD